LATKMLVSRPLCSSQGTGGGRSESVACVDTDELRDVVRGGGSRGRKQTSQPTPSGLNSVPRAHCASSRTFRAARAAVLGTRCSDWRPTGQCSTHEHRPRDVRPRRGPGPGR